MNPTGLRAMVGAIVLVLTTAGCEAMFRATTWKTETIEFNLPADGIEQLVVSTQNGAITVVADPEAKTIIVQAVKRAGAESEAAAERGLDAIQIISNTDRNMHKLSWTAAGAGDGARSVTFLLQVPARLGVALSAHNGDVQAAGLQASAVLRSHNGNLVLREHTGPVDAEVENGNLDVGGDLPQLKLTARNGSLVADLARTETVEGAITSHNGNVTLKLGSQTAVQLFCTTRNGRIRSEWPLQSVGKTRGRPQQFVCRIGRGGGTLKVESHNGSIVLK